MKHITESTLQSMSNHYTGYESEKNYTHRESKKQPRGVRITSYGIHELTPYEKRFLERNGSWR